AAGKGAEPVRVESFADAEWLVIARRKQFGIIAPQSEQAGGDEQFLAPILPCTSQFTAAHIGNLVEQPLALREIERPAVVGIDQAEIPQLAALIDVRDPRHGQL